MKSKKHILIFFLLICAALLVSCSGGGEMADTEILSAKIRNDRDTLVVEATLDGEYLDQHSGEEIYLLSPATCDTGNLSSAEVVGQAKAKKNLKFKISLDEHKLSAGSPFVLARMTSGAETDRVTFEAISEIEYISNPDILATTGISPEKSKGLKGLYADELTDAVRLGADKVILEMNIEEFIFEDYRAGAVNYSFNGRSFYFNKAAIEELDKKISEANTLGLRVYLRSLLGAPAETTPEYLYCSGVSKNAEFFCVNMANKQASEAIRALYSFIGSRYSGKDSLVVDHIIGTTVNLNSKTCNAGAVEDAEFYTLYSAWVRTAYNAAISNNSSAKVYVPVNNSIHVEGAGIGVKTFLSGIAAEAVRSGNFGFGIALDLGAGEDLGALLSGNSADYMSVGVGNLDSFTSLLDAEDMLFQGRRRDIIIDNLSLDASISEENRAAYYICAYYKAAEAGFDALFYNGDKLLSEGGKENSLFFAIRACGDKNTASLRSMVEKMPYGDDLGFKDYVSQRLKYEEEASLEIGRGSLSNKKDVSVDLSSFVCGGGAFNADVSSQTSIFGMRGDRRVGISCS